MTKPLHPSDGGFTVFHAGMFSRRLCRLLGAAFGLLGLGLVGCRLGSSSSNGSGVGEGPGQGSRRAEEAESPNDSSAPIKAPSFPLSRAGDVAALQGATITLARIVLQKKDKRLLFVADADSRTIRTVDPNGREQLAATFAGGVPSQLLVAPDGRLYVALRDRSEVAAFEATGRPDGGLTHVFSVKTNEEPIALALSVGGDTLFSVSGWGHALNMFRLDLEGKTLPRRLRTVDLPDEPRALVPTSDGQTVLVSHANRGALSAIDLPDETAPSGEAEPSAGSRVRAIDLGGGDTKAPEHCAPGMSNAPIETPIETTRFAVQAYALATADARVFAPLVLVRPGNPAFRSDGYGGSLEDLPSEISALAVLEGRGHVRRSSVHVQASTVASHLLWRRDCLLPRAASVDRAAGSVLVVCQGVDAVLDLPTNEPDPMRAEKRRFVVDMGPTGITLDPESREAFVYAQFANTVTVLSLGAPTSRANLDTTVNRGSRIELPKNEGEDEAVALGRVLFYRTGDKRISRDGRACASCHPDGRQDGLVWSTPDGPRQAPMLAGRIRGTAPYGWAGEHPTLTDHIAVTLQRLGGKGLSKPSLTALVAYVESLEGPIQTPPVNTSEIERGRGLFVSDEVGCARCHREARSFSDGDTHDVASFAAADRSRKIDTPSLRFVGGTGPYFHDGRYATLTDVLERTEGVMGATAHLSERDRNALLLYLKSL